MAQMKAEDVSDLLARSHDDMTRDVDYGDRLKHIFGILDGRLKKFLRDDGEVYPAVDLASGYGYFPLAYARHYHPNLHWYPTDYNGCRDNPPVWLEGNFGELRCLLTWFHAGDIAADRTEGKTTAEIVFTDANGRDACKGDLVVLVGLSAKAWNHHRGIVTGWDPGTNQQRVAVRVMHRRDTMSFKPTNLELLPISNPISTGADPSVLPGLIERARLVDILDRKTWPNVVDEIGGRCAAVTCTSLLTCLGHRNPEIWKDCLELASKLLVPGGYFLQYDTARFGRFGHGKTMKAFAEEKKLGLVLEGRKEEQPCGHHGKMYILLWKKAE